MLRTGGRQTKAMTLNNLRRILLLTALAFTGSRSVIAESPKSETPDTLAWIQFLATEVRELRRELLDDRIERQETRIRSLERELQQARLEREQAEAQRRTMGQQMLDIERQLTDPAMPPEQREELAVIRAAAMSRGPADTVVQRDESRLTETLRREQIRLEWLRGLARSLAPPSTGSQQ